MTVTVGGDKISRLTLGNETFVNSEDVWLPCRLGPGFEGSPILMKYDKATGITSILGSAAVNTAFWLYRELNLNLGMLQVPILFRELHCRAAVAGASAVVVGASYYMSTGAIFMYGKDHKTIMANYGLFYLLDPANKGMDSAGLYPVEIDIEKE